MFLQRSNLPTSIQLSPPTTRFVSTNHRIHSISRTRTRTRSLLVPCSTSPPPGKVHDNILTNLQTLVTEEEEEEEPALKKRPVLSRPARVYTVKDEELVVDKVLTGRVRSILTFGAFVDVGARIDGLIHVSKLAAGYVRNVEDVVRVGDEVKVQVLDVDFANQRMKLQRCFPEGEAAPGDGKGMFRSNGSSVKQQVGTTSPKKEVSKAEMNETAGKVESRERTSYSREKSSGGFKAQSRETPSGTAYRNNTSGSTPGAAYRNKSAPAAARLTDEKSKETASASGTPAAPGEGEAQTERLSTNRGDEKAPRAFGMKPGGSEEGKRRPARTRLSGNVQVGRTRSFKKGEVLVGVVKNYTAKGCFVQLDGNEEGFLHANEVNEGVEPVPIEKLVKVGEELKVRVLRVIEGRINLTMKEELDVDKMNERMNRNVHASNAFELAFRGNAVLRSYLERSERLNKESSEAELKE